MELSFFILIFAPSNLNNMLIILGTAHSKSTPGKRSPDGKFREYLFSREVCKEIKKVLKSKGYNCVIDIEGDEEYSLANRCNIVNRYCRIYGAKNCLYVSIHVNAAATTGWSNASGLSVYVYTKGSQSSKDLAKTLYNEGYARNLKGNRYIPAEHYWTADYYVLKYTNCPAVLTENLFQTNKEEVEFLMSQKGKQTIIDYHVDGIIKYLRGKK